ncbi:MAG TPA: LON peptidase substrate-binding domain-containing protein, partial [Candidatus Krumholzibacterium sp.]|nr:LON peptidase substrate-binding domain-containing protein [Candidatus Krumholzibacterium sp.]
KKMDDLDQVFPIVPLRDVVIFPSMATAILVGRQPSVNAVERAIETDKILLVITQKNATDNDPGAADLYKVGTIVRIGLFFRLPDGTIKLMLEGVNRVRVTEYIDTENYMSARVEPFEEEEEGSRQLEALSRKVESYFTDYVRMNQRVPNEVLLSLQTMESSASLADTVAAHLIIRNDVKQSILETESLLERLMMLSRILTEELEILQVEKDIDEKVSSQVQKSQKELFLHEKMKVIRDELGHGDEMEQYNDLRRRIRKARMGRVAQKVAFKELDRLKMMSPMTPEATVVRNYLDTLTGLPWKNRTKDNLDLEEVKKRLDADHYGLTKVKERIIEFLSVVKLTGNLKGPILCFVGPPGVGKTSLGRSIADAIGRKFVR